MVTNAVPVDLIFPILAELVYIDALADGYCHFCGAGLHAGEAHEPTCAVTLARDVLNVDQERAIAELTRIAWGDGNRDYTRDRALLMLGI